MAADHSRAIMLWDPPWRIEDEPEGDDVHDFWAIRDARGELVIEDFRVDLATARLIADAPRLAAEVARLTAEVETLRARLAEEEDDGR